MKLFSWPAKNFCLLTYETSMEEYICLYEVMHQRCWRIFYLEWDKFLLSHTLNCICILLVKYLLSLKEWIIWLLFLCNLWYIQLIRFYCMSIFGSFFSPSLSILFWLYFSQIKVYIHKSASVFTCWVILHKVGHMCSDEINFSICTGGIVGCYCC